MSNTRTRTAELTRALLPGEAVCSSCGLATPIPAVGDPHRFEIQVGGTADLHSASGRGFIPGQPAAVYVFGVCADCTPRHDRWTSWMAQDAHHGEVLSVAARLLGVDGDPDEAVRVAGLVFARPGDPALYGLRFLSWVMHDPERRAGQCARAPLST